METKKWYVGQKVWDKTVSEDSGKIECFNNPVEKYPIIVNFSGFKQCYTLDGRLGLDILIPTLSTTPYEIKMEGFSQEVEEKLPKKGQIVWGLDLTESKWIISHFMKKEGYHYRLSPTNDDDDVYYSWKSSEITTKNPYEVEEDREPQIGDMVYAWNNEIINTVVCGELENIYSAHLFPFALKGEFTYKYCSLKNPLIK